MTRAELAYALVQSLGLEGDALARNGDQLTVQYGDQRVPIADAADVPAELRGYVQLALDLKSSTSTSAWPRAPSTSSRW